MPESCSPGLAASFASYCLGPSATVRGTCTCSAAERRSLARYTQQSTRAAHLLRLGGQSWGTSALRRCLLVRAGAPWPPVTPISSAVHGPPAQLLPRQEWAPILVRKNSPGLGAASSKPPPRKAPYRSSVGQLQRCPLLIIRPASPGPGSSTAVCGGFFQLSSSRPSKPPTLLTHSRSRSHSLFLPLLIPSHTHSRNARLAFAINPLLLFPHIGVCVSSLLLATINEGFKNGWQFSRRSINKLPSSQPTTPLSLRAI